MMHIHPRTLFIALGLCCLAIVGWASWMDRRRQRRTNPDRVGIVSWPLVLVLALTGAAVMACWRSAHEGSGAESWFVRTSLVRRSSERLRLTDKRRTILQAGFQIGLVEAELPGLVERIGPQAHRAIFADDLAVGALVEIFELEQFLRDDHRAFHADHLGDVGDAARTVAQALDLDDQIDRVGDLAQIASLGTLMSDIITMFSIRARASRGELE